MKSDNSEILSLISKYKENLGGQIIDENQPGTILRDFETILQFILENRVAASKANDFIALNLLPSLNEKLHNPIIVSLKRPQQKSFPHIHGLYLLARATGIVVVENVKNKSFLVVDKKLYHSWQKLNATERYFNLLEAWFIRGCPEILNERGLGNYLSECKDFMQRIPDEGMKVSGNKQQENLMTYFPGLFNVALLELFGLLTIEHGKPKKGKGWRIIKVKTCAFGNALLELLNLLYLRCLMEPEQYFFIFGGMYRDLGIWQKDLQTVFPEWHNNLIIPKFEFCDGIYIFKVSLTNNIWRKISIPGKQNLDNLSNTILDAFDFGDDHLYSFTYKTRFGTNVCVNHPFVGELPITDEVSIGDLPLQIGQSMDYLYDFGDCWEFKVTLEEIDPANNKIKKPKIIEECGESPEQYP